LVTQRPDWFHGQGRIEDWNDPAQLVRHDVHGLPDLDQGNPAVYEYLLQASKGWLERARPDGYRLDAVKHISLDFWQRYLRDLKQAAPAGFITLGEQLDGNPSTLQRVYAEGGFDSLFDFPL